MKTNKTIFITLEGCEGAGKSVQSSLLAQYLKSLGREAVVVREPGGTPFSEQIRQILLSPQTKLTSISELFLYESARANLVNEKIKPALAAGKIVISDRFIDATVAYQGFGRGLDISMIEKLNSVACAGLEPTLTLYLDVDVKEGLMRAKQAEAEFGADGDRMERESLDFHNAVRNGYLYIVEMQKERVKFIEAKDGIDATQKAIRKEVDKIL
jgi:dTMP kinase